MAASPQISYEKGKLYDLPLAELQPLLVQNWTDGAMSKAAVSAAR
jgi:hypothetical protein